MKKFEIAKSNSVVNSTILSNSAEYSADISSDFKLPKTVLSPSRLF